MIPLSVETIAQIVGGHLNDAADPAAVVDGSCEFDSRAVVPGSLFVCLPGSKADGHDYVDAAVDKGAVCALAARDVEVPAIMVPRVSVKKTNASFYELDPAGDGASVIAALSKLARYVTDEAKKAGMVTVGVTGSAGKTSTKDMIATVLRAACGEDAGDSAVIAPPGSFNNEIGLPYTALKVDADTKFLVAEMAARGVGHIAQLVEITPPDVAVVLNVGHAHVGEFGSADNIARAKGEIVEDVDLSGLVVLNADDPQVAAMESRTRAPIRFFSSGNTSGPAPDVWATDVTLDDESRAHFTVHHGTRSAQVDLKVHGAHQVSNAMAAACVGLYAGMSLDAVAAALSSHEAQSAHRMAVTVRRDGLTIIDDSYNANPESMRAAIAALAATSPKTANGIRWAVLGQMGELGESSIDEHAKLADVLHEHGITHLVAVGQGVATHALTRAAEALGITVEQAQSAGAAANIIDTMSNKGDVVLVKASYADHLWDVAQTLIDRDRLKRVL